MKKPKPKKPKAGTQYGTLVLIGEVRGLVECWQCRCHCGQMVIASITELALGQMSSCAACRIEAGLGVRVGEICLLGHACAGLPQGTQLIYAGREGQFARAEYLGRAVRVDLITLQPTGEMF